MEGDEIIRKVHQNHKSRKNLQSSFNESHATKQTVFDSHSFHDERFVSSQLFLNYLNEEEKRQNESVLHGGPRESTRRLSQCKEHNSYISYASDEELKSRWENEAKTDYTFSESVSYREKVTPDRQIMSPNMSRRPLHNTSGYVKSSDFTSTPDVVPFRRRSLYSPLTLHYGLDAESDTEDYNVRHSSKAYLYNKNSIFKKAYYLAPEDVVPVDFEKLDLLQFVNKFLTAVAYYGNLMVDAFIISFTFVFSALFWWFSLMCSQIGQSFYYLWTVISTSNYSLFGQVNLHSSEAPSKAYLQEKVDSLSLQSLFLKLMEKEESMNVLKDDLEHIRQNLVYLSGSFENMKEEVFKCKESLIVDNHMNHNEDLITRQDMISYLNEKEIFWLNLLEKAKSDSKYMISSYLEETKPFIVQEAHSESEEIISHMLTQLLPDIVKEEVSAKLNTSSFRTILNEHKMNTYRNSGNTNLKCESSIYVNGRSGLNTSEVQKIVQNALELYDADKTGMVDHALESAGGTIVSTRCTEGYQVHKAEVSIFGFPLYRYSTNTPRTVIQPDRMPGQCWAFRGSQGYIVIRLAGPVNPSGFTLEHIPRALAPSGNIDSAPKEFRVLGLFDEKEEGTELGKYVYYQRGNPLQYFSVQRQTDVYYPFIELQILSNHGNLVYTCVYRFRVHGIRQR